MQIGVLQSLADVEPDVDAIFRKIIGTPVDFRRPPDISERVEVPKPILLIPESSFTPYNAQATLHFKRAFFALYLPISVSGRVSDIWRSYIAQAIFKLCHIRVGFPARPLVVQVRNAHNLNVRLFCF